MFDGQAFGSDDRLIDESRGAIEKRAARRLELETRLAQISETARSPDGLVTLTVGPAGDLVALDLGEGIRSRAAAVTARQILATLRDAHVALVAAVTTAAAETVGVGTAAGRAIISAYVEGLGPPSATSPSSPGSADLDCGSAEPDLTRPRGGSTPAGPDARRRA